MRSARFFVAAVLLGAGVLTAPLALAQDKQAGFAGLWEGVDIVDGSLRTVAIADLDGDGIWDVHAHDTFWTLCAGPQGIAAMTGTIEADGVLRVKGIVRCPDGKEIDGEATYTPQGDLADGAIVEHLVGTDFVTLMFRKSR